MGRIILMLVLGWGTAFAQGVPNGGFESGDLTGWKTEGEAFAVCPIDSGLQPGWRNWHGDYYANSWSSPAKYEATGRLRSVPFTLEQGGVAFLMSGWGSGRCFVRLCRARDGMELDRVTALLHGDLGFYPAMLVSPASAGQEVYVEVVDDGSARDDWICVDAFRQTVYDPDALPKAVDVSGNWFEGEAFPPHIQTREPKLSEGETRVFRQVLRLTPGVYDLLLYYDPNLDVAGHCAVGDPQAPFDGLRIDGQTQALRFEREDERSPWMAQAHIEMDTTRDVTIALDWGNTRPPRTRLLVHQSPAASERFHAIGVPGRREDISVRGIPFRVRRLEWFRASLGVGADHGSLFHREGPRRYEAPGVPAKAIHFLGMIHNIDLANGSWYSPKGDHGFSHFVGDRAGEVVLEWGDGETSVVPLVFGYNLWYGRPWDISWNYNWGRSGPGYSRDDEMFSGKDEPRRTIEEHLPLVDGVRTMGSESCNGRYVFSLNTQGRVLRAITLRPAGALHDVPLISAITVETDSPTKTPGLPDLAAMAPATRLVPLEEAERAHTGEGIDALQHLLYTFVDELPKIDEPMVTEGYFGPTYRFAGPPEATYAACFLYRNGSESASHVADTGVACSSPVSVGQLAQYMEGMGVWYENKVHFGSLENWFDLYKNRAPGELPGLGAGWTRGEAPLFREAMAFGYDKFVDSYLDWLDDCLLTQSNPPHWGRVAGPNHASYEVQVGDTLERGNRENDGHGMCMSARYMVYHWKGRPAPWARRRWEATAAAADWIQWQLDTDHIRPGGEKDVLYTESECAHGSYDIYSSYHCLHGLKLSIRMAEDTGEEAAAARWRETYDQLRRGILDHLVDDTAMGPVWHTDPHCDWQDHAHALVHIDMASDGDSFTPLQDYAQGDALDRRYLEISRNTYRYLMRERNYNCLRMYGYGQAYMTQAALLLDEMRDAEQFVNMLVRHAWLPNFAGWACPEGIITHRSGKFYLPVNGYMGQDVHLGEATKTMRLMLGWDDNDPDHLRLVPRYPASWTAMEVGDFPVLIGRDRETASYTYQRAPGEDRITYRLGASPGRFSVRFGPYAPGTQLLGAKRNGTPVPFETLDSGDSRWAWVEVGKEREGEVVVTFQVPAPEGSGPREE